MASRTIQSLIQHMRRKSELFLLCFLMGVCLALLQTPVEVKNKTSIASYLVEMVAPKTVTVASHDDLDQMFAKHEYVLSNVSAGEASVPAIFLAKLPKDLHEIEQPSDKKDIFIRAVLPLILLNNQQIMGQRNQLIALWNAQVSGRALNNKELQFIADMADEYDVPDQNMAELISRVDIIPPSLAIAQAAEESGWGTSRFVQHGNALYGQQVYNSAHGMVPTDRPQGRTHMVRSFGSLYDTVASYAHNLNTHAAYRDFRAVRYGYRQYRQPLNSYRLIETLISYSERRGAYVQTIKRIIDVNDLRPLDDAKLEANAGTAADKSV